MKNHEVQPDLSVIIVSYNCKHYVLECLESVYGKAGPMRMEVILIDNASKDGTAGAVRNAFPEVFVVENEVNRFLRPALNQGVKLSRGRYILWLNPDTRLLTPEGFLRMIQYMDSHPRVGILGAKLLDSDGTIQPDCERFPTLWWVFFSCFMIHSFFPRNPVFRAWRYDGWDRQDTRTVDTVSGACMMIRREVFDQVGLLDETCLMYWEEPEFCRGAHQAGWSAVHFAEVEVLHHWRKGGVSGTSPEVLAPLMDQSTLNYYRKYYGSGIYRILFSLFSFRNFVSRLIKRLWGK